MKRYSSVTRDVVGAAVGAFFDWTPEEPERFAAATSSCCTLPAMSTKALNATQRPWMPMSVDGAHVMLSVSEVSSGRKAMISGSGSWSTSPMVATTLSSKCDLTWWARTLPSSSA